MPAAPVPWEHQHRHHHQQAAVVTVHWRAPASARDFAPGVESRVVGRRRLAPIQRQLLNRGRCCQLHRDREPFHHGPPHGSPRPATSVLVTMGLRHRGGHGWRRRRHARGW